MVNSGVERQLEIEFLRQVFTIRQGFLSVVFSCTAAKPTCSLHAAGGQKRRFCTEPQKADRV
jgi:hypothetical protein